MGESLPTTQAGLEPWSAGRDRELGKQRPARPPAWSRVTVLGIWNGSLLTYLSQLHPGPCRGTEF